jgi:ribonuclease D
VGTSPKSMTTPLPPPSLVENQRGVDAMLRVLEGLPEIAVDTEADSFFSYREKVCLIQITADGRDFIVDPLAGIDLGGIGEVFADRRTIKIFHDGEYDVLILRRDHGFSFAGLFDTRIAAAALGATNPGLASVLEEHFGVVLDKSMQRSNWGERPLTNRQIDYARLDTHYLERLKAQQEALLEEKGRAMIVEGECHRLEQLQPTPNGFNPDEWVRLKGARKLRPDARQVLRELCILRDRLAEEQDQPLFRVINNAALIGVALAEPRTVKELTEIQGISWRQARKIGTELIGAVERAHSLGPLNLLPRLSPKDGTGDLDPVATERHDRLKAWRRDRAAEEGYDASLVLNRHALLRLARKPPSGRKALGGVEGVLEWQAERFGSGLLELFRDFDADLAAGRITPGRRRRARRS